LLEVPSPLNWLELPALQAANSLLSAATSSSVVLNTTDVFLAHNQIGFYSQTPIKSTGMPAEYPPSATSQ
jgi:hypothetical protein